MGEVYSWGLKLLEKRGFKVRRGGKKVTFGYFALFHCFSYDDINWLIFLFCSLSLRILGLFSLPKHLRFVSVFVCPTALDSCISLHIFPNCLPPSSIL